MKTRLKQRIKTFLIRNDLWDEPVVSAPVEASPETPADDWKTQVDATMQALDENVDIDTLIAELEEEPWSPQEAHDAPEDAGAPEDVEVSNAAPATEAAENADPDEGLTMERVQQLLDDMVRPALQMDGGDLTLVKIEDNNVYVRLVGACQSCPSSIMTMKMGIERLLLEEFPEMGELIQVDDPFAEFSHPTF